MTTYLKCNNLIYHNQFGYREGHSTNLASATLVEKIIKQLDKGRDTVAVFMDLSKAFDTIDHEILIRKLSISFNFSTNSLSLIRDYLTNRKQFVEIDGRNSVTREVNLGVPQVSILGSLFFILYINDISKASDLFDSLLYADDTTLTYSPDL